MAASSALLTALRSGTPPRWLLDLDLPDGKRYYSDAGFGADGIGNYRSRVLSWGSITHEPSDTRSGALANIETSVDLDDSSREFSSLLEDQYTIDQVIGSEALIRIGAEGVASGSWYELFRGRIAPPGPDLVDTTARFVLRMDDTPLLNDVPGDPWVLRRADWPHADASVYGEVTPVVYGTHDSAAWTNQGFLPVLRVDNRSDQWRDLICAGYISDLKRVYQDGTQVTSGFSYSPIVRNGRTWSTILWSSDPGSATITCDVDGIEDQGDGGGSVLTDPAAQLEHFLINFVFGDYRTGTWAASHARVDSTSLSALSTTLTARGYDTARRIATRQKADSLLAEWAKSHELRFYWVFPGASGSGKIGAKIEDPTETSIYTPTHQRQWVKDRNLLRYVAERRDRVAGYTVESVYDESQSGYLNPFAVVDPNRYGEATESLSLRWGPAS